MYMHPTTHLWMIEQDRERAMTQRALERAARSGGEQHPGLARGGISGFTRILRQATGAASRLHLGHHSRTARPTGSPSL